MGKYKNITKMDYPDQDLHGYYVRIQRDEKKSEKFFSATKAGSMEEALAEALEFRDEVLQRWQDFCGSKDEKIQYKTTNTGFPGISISHSDGHPVFEINLRDENGQAYGRTLNLPPKDDKSFKKEFEKKFKEAKEMVNTYNRKRFGGRWHKYKKRKGIE